MMRNKKTTWIIALLIVCLAFVAAGMYLNMNPYEERVYEPVSSVSVVEEEEEVIDLGPDQAAFYKQINDDNEAVNSDYIGTLFFDSNLINQPVVQGYSNSEYVRTDWRTLAYDDAGSNFMDFECTPESENTVIYGHYVYPSYDASGTMRFTPLTSLLHAENYEANRTVYLLLENEIREYVVCSVYFADLQNIDGVYYSRVNEQYNLPDYTPEYFTEYHTTVKAKQLYETGEDFTYEDKLLTLQTCVENRSDQREIVVCRQVNTYPITDRCDFPIRDMTSSEKV